MLKLSQIRRPSSHSYICWKCAANYRTWVRPSARYPSINAAVQDKTSELRARQILQVSSRRSFSITQLVCYALPTCCTRLIISQKGAEVEEHNTSSEDQSPHEAVAQEKLPIRERLQLWEAENSDKHVFIGNFDAARPGIVGNNATRIDGDEFEVDEDAEAEVDHSYFTQDDLLDIGSKRGYFVPGDLVELLYVLPIGISL
jgi:hypothetical protein